MRKCPTFIAKFGQSLKSTNEILIQLQKKWRCWLLYVLIHLSFHISKTFAELKL